MKKTLIALMTVVTVGCASPQEVETVAAVEPEATEQEVTEQEVTEQETETPEPAEEPEAADNELLIGTQTVETGGFVLTVDAAAYFDRDELGPDAQEILEPGTKSLISLKVSVENTTDETLAIYPDQGTLVVGSEQMMANVWVSDSVGGDFYGPVSKEGTVVFESTQTTDEIVAAGGARYIVDAPHNEDFASTGDDVDLNLNWGRG